MSKMHTIELIGGPQDGFKLTVPSVDGLLEWRSPAIYRIGEEFVYRPDKEFVEGEVFKLKFEGYEPTLV
jgi:hypothetical protein